MEKSKEGISFTPNESSDQSKNQENPYEIVSQHSLAVFHA